MLILKTICLYINESLENQKKKKIIFLFHKNLDPHNKKVTQIRFVVSCL